MSDRYNGWTNYETWNVALWLCNDEGNHKHWCDAAQEAWESAEATKTWDRRENAVFALADRLKDEIAVKGQPKLEGCYGDLLRAALEVDWREIAEHYIDDVEKDDEVDVV